MRTDSLLLVGLVGLALLASAGADQGASPPTSRRLFAAVTAAAEPAGVFDKLQTLLGNGAEITKKLASRLEEGAGGMDSAGGKVADTVSKVTDRATEVGHKALSGVNEAAEKVRDFLKAPFNRRRGGDPRHRFESGQPEEGYFEDENEANVEDTEDQDESAEQESPRERASEREAVQRALAQRRELVRQTEAAQRAQREAQRDAERDAERQRRRSEHAAEHQSRSARSARSSHHTHTTHSSRADRDTAQPVAQSGRVGGSRKANLSYTQAKRAALQKALVKSARQQANTAE